MADISSITLPGGGTYDLKDKNAVPKYGMGKNLLRNWYFVGGGTGRGVLPVNQRGLSSYTSNPIIYSIDGWKFNYLSGSTVDILSSGIQLTFSGGNVTQTLSQELLGKEVTISCLTATGLYIGTGTLPSAIPSSTTPYVTVPISDSISMRLQVSSAGPITLAFGFGTGTVSVLAAKVELGTEQTLCHNEGTAENPVWVLNEIPDYEYELYRCITSTADPSDTYANKSLATEQQLAYVETGTTASQNYTAGQYICWQGKLYTADKTISSGSTFYTSGGNKNLTECVGGGFNRLVSVFGTWSPNANATVILADRCFYMISGNLLLVNIAVYLNSELNNHAEIDIISDLAATFGRTIRTSAIFSTAAVTYNALNNSLPIRIQVGNNKLYIRNDSGAPIPTNYNIYSQIMIPVY